MKKSIKITSSHHKELCTKVTVKGNKFLVLTEDLGLKDHRIITKVYLGGKIISTRTADYKNIINKKDAPERLKIFMQEHHETVIRILKTEKEQTDPNPMKYLDQVMSLLQKKDHQAALELLAGVLKQYPDEPYILSYYGCLDAILNKNCKEGIRICLRSIDLLEEKVPFGQEFFYPILYLNLGRAYLSARKKKQALQAFQKGLGFDGENKELLKEIRKLGVRRKTAVPYLARTNPINKYIGKMIHTIRS
jgi:tetratricopeptide (TPR) repeat protein